jgi:predicted N-formylglutamate amidohydrolase
MNNVLIRLDSTFIGFDSTFIRLLFDFNKDESNKTRIESASYSTVVESNMFNIRFEQIESNTNKGHIRFNSAVEKH